MKRVIGLLTVVGLLGACAQDTNAPQELESLAGGVPHEGHCNGTSNSEVTCDPNTQLEWLDLTVTQGKSIADVESQLGAGGEYAGYRHATLSELDQLLENANVADEINGYYSSNTKNEAFRSLQKLLGVTYTYSYTWNNEYGSGSSNHVGAFGFLKDFYEYNGQSYETYRRYQYLYSHEYSGTSYDQNYEFIYDAYDGSYWNESGYYFLGHFLVKEVAPADTTPPETSISEGPADLTKQKTASFTFTSNEPGSTFACSLDGAAFDLCTSPQTYNDLSDGSHIFKVKATDKAGNTDESPASHSWTVDTTAPTNIQFVGMSNDSSFYRDFVAEAPTCSADDATSGVDRCVVTGYSTVVGSHTLTATATDKAGNSASSVVTYTVLEWRIDGFHRPIEMGENVMNVIKNGSTAIMKFNVYVSGTEITSTGKTVMSVAQLPSTQCSTSLNDEIDLGGTTGSTSLRYSDNQFAYNWQTPKKVGNCYNVTMTYDSGPSITAKFRLK